MKVTIQTNLPEETQLIGQLLAIDAFPKSLIVLSGDLGAGKTTFTKGIAVGLGIQKVIKSPTYTLIREYIEGQIPLYHMDMYRIEESGGASELGLEEYIEGDGVTVVEWANFIEEQLPEERLVVSIERVSLEERKISVIAIGDMYLQWLQSFEKRWNDGRSL